jgi:LL-diaminopimelate aminotransferase
LFNGASNITQPGGLAALTDSGIKETQELVGYYKANAAIIQSGLAERGIKTYGGTNAPYLWAHFPGKQSWDVFEAILEKAQVVTTPGAGFGPAGEGFIRFSSFGHRENVIEAMERIKQFF